MLQRDVFSSDSSPSKSVDSGEAAGKPDCPRTSVILTRRIGTLQDLFSIYPKVESTFRGSIRAATLDKGIKTTDFQLKKERMLILRYLLKNYPNLTANQTRSLGDAVLFGKDKQKTLDLLKDFSKGEKSGWFSVPSVSVPWGNRKPVLPKEEAMWRAAYNSATTISDPRFLSYIKSIPVGQFLHDAAVKSKCEETAYDALTTQLDSMVSGISQQILSTQKEQCDRQVQREVKSEEEKELKASRAEFVQQIEELCRERSRS